MEHCIYGALQGVLTMGCSVTLGSGTALNIDGFSSDTPSVLFRSVEALTLGDTAVTEDCWYDAYGTIATLNAAAITMHGQYVIGYHKGIVSFALGNETDPTPSMMAFTASLTALPAMPEPSTATLSLLAMAALAARRRRK